jgi:hypothetical protein
MSSRREIPGDEDDTMALCAGGFFWGRASLQEFLAGKVKALSLPAGRLWVCWYVGITSRRASSSEGWDEMTAK